MTRLGDAYDPMANDPNGGLYGGALSPNLCIGGYGIRRNRRMIPGKATKMKTREIAGYMGIARHAINRATYQYDAALTAAAENADNDALDQYAESAYNFYMAENAYRNAAAFCARDSRAMANEFRELAGLMQSLAGKSADNAEFYRDQLRAADAAGIDAAAADDAAINAGDAAAPFDWEYWADIAPDGTSAAAIRRDGIRPMRDHY